MKLILKVCFLALLILIVVYILRYIKIFEVPSSSMEPAIRAGSIIAVIRTNEARQKDIIVYKTPQNIIPVTHRVIKVLTIHGKVFYITKGDNNVVEDPYPISESEIIGKVLFIIPYLGLILKTISSYRFLSITFYGPIGFLFGKSIKNLIHTA